MDSVRKKVVFLHPDLGIGGAERLVVDAALALKSKGHDVSILTSHHSPSHCFEETRDGTLHVECYGDWLPRSLFGRFYALCAYFRMIYVALVFVLCGRHRKDCDVVFVDQISACIPVIKVFAKSIKVVFYCHFPDQLLTDRKSALKAAYRKPLDRLEEVTTGMADIVLVNSKFTRDIFHKTFLTLNMEPKVLYPSLDTTPFDRYSIEMEAERTLKEDKDEVVFLSLNRYERKKNLGLAIKALANICRNEEGSKIKLIIAGGYDPRVSENVEHHAELQKLASDNGVEDKVIFMKSISQNTKNELLLKSATALIYTPSREHFGIVPIEAMYCRLPVIAVNNGGPTETVVHDETGFLMEADSIEFAKAMKHIIKGGAILKEKMGENGRRRVKEFFSFPSFALRLHEIITL